MASTVEQKSAQFVAQFAATVFAQWTQTQEKERFWLNAAFLRDLLEEAVAKLPKIALKGHLVRELQPAVVELKKLLEAHYAEHQQHESAAAQSKSQDATHELLNEEDVERALATADDAKRRELAVVLALDEYASITTKMQEVASVAQIEAYVAQLQRISARSYESPDELTRKRGFYMQRIVGCAEQLVAKWATDKSGNWDCAPTSPHSVELQQLRVALQQIVGFDAVAAEAAVSDLGASNALLSTPWTSFYRPNESPLFVKVDYEAEIAKVFGVLLTLAIYFPIVLDDDDDEATSDESASDSDSDSDNEPQTTSESKKQNKLDFLEQAKRTVHHVVFAAKQRSDALWLVAVLTFLHQLPKPKSYRDDEDDLALEAADQRALQDCLCDVYSRAFANPLVLEAHSSGQESGRASDWLLFQTVVCLRHAAQFMRSERRQSIPAVTTAMVKLVSIPLPPSFWQWLAHVKKLYALQSPAVRDAMKKLTKNKSSKMANALLSATDVTNEELEAVAEVRCLMDGYLIQVTICDTNTVIVILWLLTRTTMRS